MSGGGHEQRAIRPTPPIGDPRRAEFEANPASPILRFLPGHSEGIMAALKPHIEKVQAGIPGFPNSFMHITFNDNGGVNKYVLEFTAEELAGVLTAASEGLPRALPTPKPLILPKLNLPRKEAPSNDVLGTIAHYIEQELANGPLEMQQELLQLLPPGGEVDPMQLIRERLQFVNGLQQLQRLIKGTGLTLGLSDKSRELLEADENLVPELTRLFNLPDITALPPEVAMLIDPRDLKIIQEDSLDLIFQATSPTDSTGRHITVDQVKAEVARLTDEALDISERATQTNLPIVRPGDPPPDQGNSGQGGRR